MNGYYTILQSLNGGFNFSTGLMAYWKLATNANDSSGNSHNGTPTGMTYSGGYAQFGSGKYISVGDSNDFSFTNGSNDLSAHFLISFIWNDNTSNQFFISKRPVSGTTFEWQISSRPGGSTDLVLRLSIPDGSAYIQIAVPIASITTGVLQTIQFSSDGSETHAGLGAYLNGNNPVGTTSMTGIYTGMVNSSINLRLGAPSDSFANYLKADGKEWAVWKNRTMTGTEIQELHDRVIAGTPLI